MRANLPDGQTQRIAVKSFDIRPFQGAYPILFGMSRADVVAAMGDPRCSGKDNDSYGESLEINIGYDENGAVDHLGMGPGAFELKFNRVTIRTPSEHP